MHRQNTPKVNREVPRGAVQRWPNQSRLGRATEPKERSEYLSRRLPHICICIYIVSVRSHTIPPTGVWPHLPAPPNRKRGIGHLQPPGAQDGPRRPLGWPKTAKGCFQRTPRPPEMAHVASRMTQNASKTTQETPVTPPDRPREGKNLGKTTVFV